MKNTDPHPVELLILAAVVTIEALAVLVAAAVALVVTITRRSEQRSPGRVMPAPAVHPLHELATELEQQPAATLRTMVGTRKRRSRSELVGLLVALPC